MNRPDSLPPAARLPDPLVRAGIRRHLAKKLTEMGCGTAEERTDRFSEFRGSLDALPIAVTSGEVDRVITQMPAEFFIQILGPRLQYGSGYWASAQTTFTESEEAMIELTCARAGLANGQKILELGSGWGSLTFWMAEHFPDAMITTVSDSYTQRLYLEAEVRRRELYNIRVISADMNTFSPPEPGSYDRIVSTELFGLMKNYRELMRRIAFWLQPEGKLFVQLGTHRELVGNFTDNDSSNAMIRYFFPSGTMPSHDLLLYFQDDLVIERDWKIPGTHCSRTAEAWLGMMEVNRQRISLILEKACGREHAAEWRARWRTFLMNCSEFWGYRRGEEWMISHYLFGK